MEHFFRRLAAGFTKAPDAIGVDMELVGGTISMTLRPAKVDTGSLIGAGGVMHHSFRSVLTVLARRGGHAFHLAPVVDPGDKGASVQKTVKLSLDQIGDMFTATCSDLFEKTHAWAWDADDRRSNINLMIAKNETRHVTDAELGEGLSRIFNAIGRCHGHVIYVNLERSKT